MRPQCLIRFLAESQIRSYEDRISYAESQYLPCYSKQEYFGFLLFVLAAILGWGIQD